MIDDVDDATWRRLRGLPVLEPEHGRSENVRVRCRAMLAERQRTNGASPRVQRLTSGLEAAVAGGVSVGYLVAIVDEMLRVYLRR